MALLFPSYIFDVDVYMHFTVLYAAEVGSCASCSSTQQLDTTCTCTP